MADKASIQSVQAKRDEWRRDRRRFFADVLRVRSRDPAATKLVPLVLNPAQESLHRLVEMIEAFNLERTSARAKEDPTVQVSHLPVDVVVLKPRKEGMSTYIEALAFHLCEFSPHTNALLMAHRKEGAKNIGKIDQRFGLAWPKEYAFQKVPMKKSSGDGLEWAMGEGEKEPAWDSRMIVTVGKDEGVARGDDLDFTHLSEVAHFANADAISAAKNAMMPDHYCFEESTANGHDASFYASVQGSLSFEEVYKCWKETGRTPGDWNGKFRFFWAWWQDPHYRLPVSEDEAAWMKQNLDDIETELVSRFGLSMEQLRWRRHTIQTKCSEQGKMSPEDFFRQEYPSEPQEAFVGSGNSIFAPGALKAMRMEADKAKPEWCGYLVVDDRKHVLQMPARANREAAAQTVIWEKPKPERKYIIGADVATGKTDASDGDLSVAIVFDRTDGTRLIEVARFAGKPHTRDFGDIIHWLHKTYGDAYVCCEGNYPGNSTCQRLVELHTSPMYHRKNEERVDNSEDDGFTPGFKTYAHTKALIISMSQQLIQDRGLSLRTVEAVRQHEIFVNENGRLTHPSGETDDYVIATALAVYAHFKAAAPIMALRDLSDKADAEAATRNAGADPWLQAAVKKKIARDQRRALRLRRNGRNTTPAGALVLQT